MLNPILIMCHKKSGQLFYSEQSVNQRLTQLLNYENKMKRGEEVIEKCPNVDTMSKYGHLNGA